MKPAIEIRDISKKYRLASNRANYQTLRDSIHSIFSGKVNYRDFYALKDVSFEVEPGEAIGIIGENGAGKTTILKIISRIVPPTRGKVFVRGKVSSLLEVGTGFHPELTGAENIYLNGSILGLSRKEIKKQFESILAFAEVDDFVNTPIKHYSTGMWARLAFSVAAHLNSNILLIDEVLSVGDAEFQHKSLSKMDNIINEGRTILFVSHNMASVRQFCKRCIYLSHGEIQKIGKSGEVIETYLSKHQPRGEGVRDLTDFVQRSGNQKVKLKRIELKNRDGRITSDFNLKEDLYIHLFLEAAAKVRKVKIVIQILEAGGSRVCYIYDSDSGFGLRDIPHEAHISVVFEDLRFYPGKYVIGIEIQSEVFAWKEDIYDKIPSCISFNIVNNSITHRELLRCDGLFYLTPKWQIHV